MGEESGNKEDLRGMVAVVEKLESVLPLLGDAEDVLVACLLFVGREVGRGPVEWEESLEHCVGVLKTGFLIGRKDREDGQEHG